MGRLVNLADTGTVGVGSTGGRLVKLDNYDDERARRLRGEKTQTPAANTVAPAVQNSAASEQSKALEELYKKRQTAEQVYNDGRATNSPFADDMLRDYEAADTAYRYARKHYLDATGTEWQEPANQNALERMANIYGGANLESASGYLNFAGTGISAMQGLKRDVSEKIQDAPGVVQTLAKAPGFLHYLAGGENERMTDTARKLQEQADELSQESAEKIAAAKDGLGKVGQVAVDVGKSGVQVLGDSLLNVVAPGSSLAALWTRAAGGGAQKVRQEGGSDLQQLAYGAAVGTVETLTEKMFDGLAGAYGKGAWDDVTDGVVERVVNKLSKGEAKPALEAIMRIAMSGGEEAVEEAVSGLVDPLLERIYRDRTGYVDEDGNFDPAFLSETLYSMLIGGLTGMIGGGIQAAGNAANNAQTPNSAVESVLEATERSNPQTAQNAPEGALNAPETVQAAPTPETQNVIDSLLDPRGENKKTASKGETGTGTLPRITMEDYASSDSPVWNNVAYNDIQTKREVTDAVHRQMIVEGRIVNVTPEIENTVAEGYPDLRSMKKSERVPILKQSINQLKTTIRQFLAGLKNNGSFEFEVNGNILEARLYDTGVNEVMEKITKDKASVLLQSDEIFNNAQYLYSTPDYKGNPNIYRWNYFYTPVQIGDNMVGVRIAVRDMVPTVNGRTDSQIYNWGIKKNAPLSGGEPGNTPNITGASSGAFTDTTIPQNEAGVNSEFSTDEAQNVAKPEGYDGLGAADAGFTTPTRGEMVPTQSRAITENANLDETARQEYAPEEHEQVTAPMSMERAQTMFYTDENGNITNLHDTVDPLLEKDTWTGAEQDAAQMALTEARRVGDLDYAAKIADAINRIGGTEIGRSLQARQKWIGTGDGAFSESSNILGDPRISDDIRRDTLQHINDFANDLDNAGDINDYVDIIRRTAVLRNTARSEDLTRTINWAINRAVMTGDTDFMRNAAYSSIIALAQDQIPTSLSEKARAYRRDSMLSKVSTWMRNITSNGTFDIMDSIAHNISVPVDMLLSRFTGQRSVSTADVVSRAKLNAQLDALAKSVVEVGLDISAEGAESAYGSTGNRTFKMNGGVVERLLSRWERTLNYAMYSTDQFQKGGIESTVQRSADSLYARGLVNDETLRNAGRQEALYRTFQQDGALASSLSAIRRGLNSLSQDYIRGNLQLGDIMMPFVQVPANLLSTTIDYTPLGLAKTALQTYRHAENGTLTAAQQARVSQAFGRALTGTGIIALSAFAKALGILTVSDDGKEEDKDKSALESQSNLKGTQLNLSALVRALQGENPERQEKDVLMSLGFLDPMNALLTIGALFYDDWASEEGYQFGDLTADSFSGIAQAATDLPFMSPVRDVANAYNYSTGEKTGEKVWDAAKQYGASQVSSFIPNFIKGLAQGTDEQQRNMYSSSTAGGRMLDSTKASLPGLRQTLPAKIDSYGNEMETGNPALNFLNNNILPGTITQYTPPSPAITEWLNDLYGETGDVKVYPNRKPSNWSVDIDGDKKADSIRLNAEEQREFQGVYGSTFEGLVDELMQSAESTSLTSEELANIVANISSYATEQAKNDYYESHDIDVRASASSSVNKAIEAIEEGISMARYYELKKEHDEIDAEDLSAYQKAAKWANYLDNSDLTTSKIKAMENILGYSSGYAVYEAEKYTGLKDNGLSANNASKVYSAVSALEPLAGSESVTQTQKVGAILGMSGLSEQDRLGAIKTYGSDSLYEKFSAAADAGISTSNYWMYTQALSDIAAKYKSTDDTPSAERTRLSKEKKKEVTDYINGFKLTNEQKTLLWQAAGYKASTSPWG